MSSTDRKSSQLRKHMLAIGGTKFAATVVYLDVADEAMYMFKVEDGADKAIKYDVCKGGTNFRERIPANEFMMMFPIPKR